MSDAGTSPYPRVDKPVHSKYCRLRSGDGMMCDCKALHCRECGVPLFGRPNPLHREDCLLAFTNTQKGR